jgi:hypothetical protein
MDMNVVMYPEITGPIDKERKKKLKVNYSAWYGKKIKWSIIFWKWWYENHRDDYNSNDYDITTLNYCWNHH